MRSKPYDPKRWLMDIRDNIHAAWKFVEGVGYDDFRHDLMRIYATTRCLEIISEASQRLPADIKARNPRIEWAMMAGAGNVYRHDYEDVAADLLWGTIKEDLPELLTCVEAEIARFD